MVVVGINNVKYLKPCYASSALGDAGSTSMQMTLLSSVNPLCQEAFDLESSN